MIQYRWWVSSGEVVRSVAQDRGDAFLHNKIKFEVQYSRYLLMVPDETGLLEPDEVFCQRSPLDKTDYWPTDPGGVVLGNVAVCRSPAYHSKHLLLLKAVGNQSTARGRALLKALGHLHDGG